MKKNLKRLLSIILVIVMAVQLLPMTAFAEDVDEITIDEDWEEEIEEEEIPLVESPDEDEIDIIDEGGDETTGLSEANVVWENDALREERTKHYRLSDGSFIAASYDMPIHYQDSAGQWKEIDNHLEELDGSYLALTGDVEKEFCRSSELEYLFRIAVDGYELMFTAVQPLEKGKDEEPVEPPEDKPEIDMEEGNPEEEKAEIESVGERTEPTPYVEKNLTVGVERMGEIDSEDTEIIIDIEPVEEPKEEEETEDTETLMKSEPLQPETDEDLYMAGYRRISGEGMSLSVENSKGDRDVFGLPFEEAADMSRLTSTLCYTDILPGVSYIYKNTGYNVKECVVITEPNEEYRYSFAIESNGLTILTEENGDLTFANESGEEVFTIPAPYMFDAEGTYSDEVTYEIRAYEGGYLLTIDADKEWINAPERAFPISIDPTIITKYHQKTNGMTAVYVREGNPNHVYAIRQTLKLGYNKYSDQQEMQIYVGFDDLPQLPGNAVVTFAELSMVPFEWNAPVQATVDVGAYQVTGSCPSSYNSYYTWFDNLCWNNKPQTSNELLSYTTCTSNMVNYPSHWVITRAAKGWYSNIGEKAICLKLRDRENYDSTHCAVLSFLGYGGSDLQDYSPYLTISYRNTVGVENYYSYQSHSIDRAGTAYIGDHSGGLTLVKEDLSAASTVMPVSVSHVYNSAYAGKQTSEFAPGSAYSNMNVGKGWKLDFEQSISNAGSGYLQYMDGDGTIHYFQYVSAQNYQDEDGLGLTLYKIDDNGTYILRDQKGTSMYFYNGYLKDIQDESENKITYVRNSSNQVTSITRRNKDESAETIATLSYTSNQLSSISDARGTTTFSYTNNYLTQITHPDGTTVTYTYSGGILSSAKDNESGYKVSYTYSNSRVASYVENAGTNGATVTVTGEDGVTRYRNSGKDRTLGNSDDIKTSYVFDNMGRTITIYTTNADGSAIYSAAGGQYVVNSGVSKSNNRLKVDGSVGARPVGSITNEYSFDSSRSNLLTNGDMSGSSGWTGGTKVQAGSNAPASYARKLVGEPTAARSIYQTKTVNDSAGKTYLFSGWAKAASLPPKTGRSFGLEVKLTYSDDSTETQTASYCVESTEWQYLVLPVVPKKNLGISSITVRFSYNNNANDAYFTLACLTRETAASYTWDSNGNLTSVKTPGNATPTYTYSGADLISQVTRGNGTFTYTYYDNTHRVKTVTNAGLQMRLNYDTKGNTTSSTLTGGSLQMGSSATYTNSGNLLASQTDTRGKTTSYTYSNAISKQTGQPTEITDPRNTSRTIAYNSQNGRQTSTYIPDYVRLRTYYTNGLVSSLERKGYIPGVTDAVFQNYYINHNGFGQTTSIKVENRTLASYAYASHNGVLNQMTYGNGQYITYGYDNLERVKNVYYNGSSTAALNYIYWGEGQLKQLTDSVNNRTYNYTYDNLGRRTGLTEKYNGGDALVYDATYDTANRVSAYSYRISPSWNGTPYVYSRDFTYVYNNNNGSLTSYDPQGSGVYAYTYDGLRRLTQRQMSRDGVFLNRNYTYLAGSGSNTSTLVSKLENKLANGNDIASYTYSYDNGGNITAISGITAICGSTTISDSTAASYTYDVQGQMLTETRGGTTYSYTYDSYGNIRSKTDGNDTDTYTYGDSEWADLLTAYNNNSITYDAIGNPLTYYDGTTFTWVNGRRLASAVKGTNLNISYTYDSDGLRLTKTVNGVEHKYLWLNGKLISEAWDDIELEFFYDESGSPYCISCIPGAGLTKLWYFYVTNLQGDVVALLNGNGVPVTTYSYDAWGNILSSSNTAGIDLVNINPLRYRGYYYDSELGLYYLKSRYYDPQICRFINADGLASTGQGFLGCNMFAYCLNNPVNLIDKTGQDAATLAAEWGATMWWLNWVDGLLPVGDLIYWGGWGLLTIGAIIFVDYAATTYSNTSYSKPTSSSNQNAETQTKYVSDFGSTTAPPPGPNRPQNDRRTNVNKYESPQWRRFNNVKNSRLKTTGRGSNQRFYDWDYTHNDIEVYNYRGEHLGSMDPVTGEMYKPPVPGRIIKIP